MQMKTLLRGKKNNLKLSGITLCLFLLFCESVFAAGLLMTLQVDSSHVLQNEDFTLTLEVYAPPGPDLPEILVDGMDQFRKNSQVKNLIQVPSGRTVKWILQYRLTPTQVGTFKLGPAVTNFDGRRYSSNTLFVTIEKSGLPPPQKITPPAEPQIRSAEEVGDKILLFLEPVKTKPYRTEGVPVTIRLLTQLPVESLRFRDEPDFPGFLKYDFPFTEKPKAERIQFRGASYVTYQLQQFLIFPLKEGGLKIPSVTCELDVVVPSGPFDLGGAKLQVIRTTGPAEFQVLPTPDGAVVGNFVLSNQLVEDGTQSKIVRFTLEGEGLLSLFDFPTPEGPGYQAKPINFAANADLQGRILHSLRSVDLEVTPVRATTDIVLQTIRVRQWNAESKKLSTLTLPPLRLTFTPPQAVSKRFPPAPEIQDIAPAALWILTMLSTILMLFLTFRPKRKKGRPKLGWILHRKKPELQISKSSALQLYQQLMKQVSTHSDSSESLLLILQKHLPEEDWRAAEPIFRALEWTAFSPTRNALVTYKEMKDACGRVEKNWIL